MQRREFFVTLVASGGALMGATALHAQQRPQPLTTEMSTSAYRPVRLPPKPGARAALSDAEIRELELGLKCQCTCPLDVHVCRTTDPSCPVSPAMHADVRAMVDGGHNAEEILAAFRDVYGERVLMAPRAQGFNIVAYAAPFVAVAVAALALGYWITRRLRPATPVHAAGVTALPGDVSSDEMRRLNEALKRDS